MNSIERRLDIGVFILVSMLLGFICLGIITDEDFHRNTIPVLHYMKVISLLWMAGIPCAAVMIYERQKKPDPPLSLTEFFLFTFLSGGITIIFGAVFNALLLLFRVKSFLDIPVLW